MPPLTTYLVGIMYHEPEPFALWNRGVIEDYESSTGIFIDAASKEEAIAWGEVIGQGVLRMLNADESLDWNSFGYYAWIEESVERSSWSQRLTSFQHVKVGEMPDVNKMSQRPACVHTVRIQKPRTDDAAQSSLAIRYGRRVDWRPCRIGSNG